MHDGGSLLLRGLLCWDGASESCCCVVLKSWIISGWMSSRVRAVSVPVDGWSNILSCCARKGLDDSCYLGGSYEWLHMSVPCVRGYLHLEFHHVFHPPQK